MRRKAERGTGPDRWDLSGGRCTLAKTQVGRWEASEDDVQCQTGEEILFTQFFI